MATTPTVWGMHAGVGGAADSIFQEEHQIAIGWDDLGDLSGLPDRHQAFKDHMRAKGYEGSEQTIGVKAGMIYRFVHKMKKGHVVVYRPKGSVNVLIGKITGDYEYVPGDDYPNRRKIDWQKTTTISTFSQGALHVLGAFMTLFKVGEYGDEFLKVLQEYPAETVPTVEPQEDETVPLIVENTRSDTRDFVMKALDRHFKGHPLAHLVGNLLEAMDFKAEVSTPGPDHGIDIVAMKGEFKFEPPIIKVQVKSGAETINEHEVSAFYGRLDSNKENGLYIAMGGFKRTALKFAETKANLQLVDGEDLVGLILKYYTDLDMRFKKYIPLEQVYIPDVSGDKDKKDE